MKVRSVLRLALIAAAVLGVMVGGVGVANAAPMLQIVDTALNHQEVIGDAGGTMYPWGGGPGPGAGVPSAAAGWPNSTTPPTPPGFSDEPGFGMGTSGWHRSYLRLTEAADVTFQLMGGGNSSLINSFWLNPGTGWQQLFLDSHNGNPTDPCPVGSPSGVFPMCDHPNEGYPIQNQYTFSLPSGLIPFAFGLNDSGIGTSPNGPINDNDPAPAPWNNSNPNYSSCAGNPDVGICPGFFLGVDPYLATGPFQNNGTAVYAGLTDLPGPDHDFQDLGVRISVSEIPEPGTMALLGIGLIGLVVARKRKLV